MKDHLAFRVTELSYMQAIEMKFFVRGIVADWYDVEIWYSFESFTF